MYPRYHVLLGLVFSLILFIFCEKINLLAAIIIFFSSFLIDFDHYIFIAWKLKQKNIFKAYSTGVSLKKEHNRLGKNQKKKLLKGFYLFHGFEILIILFLLGFLIHKFFYFILIGFLFHLFLDYLELFFQGSKKHKFSTIVDYVSFMKSSKNFKK